MFNKKYQNIITDEEVPELFRDLIEGRSTPMEEGRVVRYYGHQLPGHEDDRRVFVAIPCKDFHRLLGIQIPNENFWKYLEKEGFSVKKIPTPIKGKVVAAYHFVDKQ